jgi:inosine/xanthosine triphosphatase
MQKIIVASENPVKINATLAGFKRMFPNRKFSVEGIAVPSGVNDQPIGRRETLQGANNRLNALVAIAPDADYWVGIEGGIEIHDETMETSAWIVIKSKDGQKGKGRTGAFILPPEITAHVHDGKELGTATDIVFGKTNSKQAGGTIAELTDGLIDRTAHYEIGVIFALIPFKSPDFYPH